MPIVNLYNKNLRCDVVFLGSALTTNQLSVISPYTKVEYDFLYWRS